MLSALGEEVLGLNLAVQGRLSEEGGIELRSKGCIAVGQMKARGTVGELLQRKGLAHSMDLKAQVTGPQ